MQFALRAAAMLAAAACAPAWGSNTIAGVRVDPSTVPAGSAAAISVATTDNRVPASCGLRIEYGDGTVEDFAAAGRDGVFPRTFNRVYTQPGNYTVRVSGRPFGEFQPCAGSAAAELRVTGATPPPPAAAGPGSPPGQPAPTARAVVQEFSLCPPGWAVSADAKDGSFTCTQLKPPKLACPQGLSYFERPGVMGCRGPARR